MVTVDLNCDMGESFGVWRMGSDLKLMDHVSSINIACGFHAGDATTIRKTIVNGLNKGVAIGAHPSFPDLQGFGRREMSLSPQEIYDMVLYQVSAVKGICEANGGRLHHVKPHGALYNCAAKDPTISEAIVKAIFALDPKLILYGLSGSVIIEKAIQIGLPNASEVFADRTYTDEGYLTPRSETDALISDADESVEQILSILQSGFAISTTGKEISLNADTICIHGDGPHAALFARRLNRNLKKAGIVIESVK